MFMRKLSLLLKPIALTAAIAFASPTIAQGWPQKSIRVVVPFSAGGNTDSIARITAEWLTQKLGQSVVVENKPGAGGAIAAELVMRAPADGYTLFLATAPQMAILPSMTKTSYDPVKDFAPITIIASNSFAMGVNDMIPAKTLREFVAYVKAHPSALAYASAGSGSVSHLTMALFLHRAKLDMSHVGYKGGAPALADVLGGQLPVYFGNLAEIIPHAKNGKIKVLAVSGEKRAPQLPDVPTVAELGYPGFRTNTWNGLAAPANTPQAVVNRIATEVGLAVRDPGFVKRLDNIGVDAIGGTPAEFARTLDSDIKIWAEAVRISGARVD